jgi:exosortase
VNQWVEPRPAIRTLAPNALPWTVAAIGFAILFAKPIAGTAALWVTDSDAGHGLLLTPIAIFLAWRAGLTDRSRPQPVLGAFIIAAAVLLRFASGLAAELFTMRLSVLGAIFGLIVFTWGFRQLLHWWLPAVLVTLSMPLPEVLMSTLALPLQFKASALGAALLKARHVPVLLEGNVIRIPQHVLFVTEACSGLRSMAALLALGFLVGGLFLHTFAGRAFLVVAALPIAILLNGFRIFLTGFSIHFIDPRLGLGLMHYTEGWAMFIAAFLMLSMLAWLILQGESAIGRPRELTPV